MIEYPQNRDIPAETLNADDKKYLHGFHNMLIRYYFYLMKGLDIPNSFRNLFITIAAIYIALKLDNILIGIAMFVVSSVILTVFGYYNVHKLAKMNEWLGMRFSTHYGIKSFNYQADQVRLLEEVRDLLKRLQK